MPELPDIIVYLEALERFIHGQTLQRIRLVNPFLLRSVQPPIQEAMGKTVIELRRLGKRIVFALVGCRRAPIHQKGSPTKSRLMP